MSDNKKTTFLFVCIGNMCRSPMAEGFARELGGDQVVVYGAGTHATGFVSEDSILLMEEIGIDIRQQTSNSLSDIPLDDVDIIVSMAPASAISLMPHDFTGRAIDWRVDDPVASGLDTFRRVRDEIRELVSTLINEVI